MTTTRRAILGVAAATPLMVIPSAAAARVAPKPNGYYRYWLLPFISAIGTEGKTQYANCWTIHHVWMHRFTRDDILGGAVAHVNSRRYRDWLAEGDYFEPESEAGIPPHIQFGGAVVSGDSDPTFHQRWVEYARREFGNV